MRSRVLCIIALLVVGAFVLPAAADAATIPFFGPIVPDGSCPGGSGMLLTVINNIITFLLTLAIVFVAPLVIAWAGFLLVFSQGNAGRISEARSLLTNLVIGTVVALSSWMIVNAVMAVLYDKSKVDNKEWWEIVVGGDYCLDQKGTKRGDGLSQAEEGSGAEAVTQKGDARTESQLTTPGNPCNPATVTAAVSSASLTNANRLACIAQGESTCGALRAPYNLNFSWGVLKKGKASSAAGAYQVLLSSNHDCYENPVCYEAVGLSVAGGTKLNCQNAFETNGMPKAGALLETCKKAAGNVQCSAAAAVCLLQEKRQSFTAAYGTDPYVESCVAKYP